MANDKLHSQNIVACVWDFDKTLIDGYMQTPIFERYGIDEMTFWNEVNSLPAIYRERGVKVSPDTVYLNHLLTYVRHGRMKGLNNDLLREFGGQLKFYPGLPGFFGELKEMVAGEARFVTHGIQLEHYIVSTGLADMIRGSAVAPFVDGIFGCELIENPLPPGFMEQGEFELEGDREVGQIGTVVDNTVKTRYLFEIKKGSNKNPEIDVNAKVSQEDHRVPIPNIIYMADGPSDVPVFAVVNKFGGRAFGVYNPLSEDEFAQNDHLLQAGRIHAYGPADYTRGSSTHMWIKMHVRQICERIVRDREHLLANRVAKPPQHLHRDELAPEPAEGEDAAEQANLFEEG